MGWNSRKHLNYVFRYPRVIGGKSQLLFRAFFSLFRGKASGFQFWRLYGSYGDYIVSFVIYIFRNLLSRWEVRVNLQLNKK